MAFPISGAIKSLGGFQFNHVLLDQAASFFRHASNPVHGALSFLNSFIGRPILFFLSACPIVLFGGARSKSRLLGLGYLIGCLLFAAKLMLFSSWAIWPWYGFPCIIGLAVLFHAIDDGFCASGLRFGEKLQAAGFALLLLGAGVWLGHADMTPANEVETINQEAADSFAPIFNNARVAMGDRSGSFAAHYAGPVTQLEGLVNDVAYLEALKGRGDLRSLLCRRGVKFVLSFQRDLGAYDAVNIPIMRPRLTQFQSPTLSFSKDEEVGRISDLSKYDNGSTDEGDNYLYAWRLTGCDRPFVE